MNKMDARRAILGVSLLLLLLFVVPDISIEASKRTGSLKDYVDCARHLDDYVADKIDSSVQNMPRHVSTDARNENLEYAEIYYESSENPESDSKRSPPRCYCSEDFAQIRCEGLTDDDGKSLFLPGAVYGRLAKAKNRSVRWDREEQTTANKTTIENSLLFTSFYLERNSVINILPRHSLQQMKFQRIVFSFNDIGKSLSQPLFSKETLESVEVLEMGRCDLGTIPPRKMLKGSKRLRHFHLWGNRIRNFPSNFFSDSTSLTELILSGNQIDVIDDQTFGGRDQLTNLKLLDLDKNRITSLQDRNSRDKPKGKPDMSAYPYMSPYDSRDEAALSRIVGPRLETLKLGGNMIQTLPTGFLSGFDRLKFLKLDNNGLSYIYLGAFDGLKSLVRLCLAWNMISYLYDDLFYQMNNLLVLELQGNRLEYIWSGTLRGLASLQTIDLSRNRLSILGQGLFQNSPSLIRVDLSHNQLQTLDECSFHRPVHRLQSVSLIDNPVLCSCEISWLWRYMVSFGNTEAGNDSFQAINTDEQFRPTNQNSFHDYSGHQPSRHHDDHYHQQQLLRHQDRHRRHRHHHHHYHHHHFYRQSRRQDDFNFQSNYSEFSETVDQIKSESYNDEFSVNNDDKKFSAMQRHMRPLRSLVAWGSCMVSRDAQQDQHYHLRQQQQHRGVKSTPATLEESKQLPISSHQVRLLFNCSLEACGDRF